MPEASGLSPQIHFPAFSNVLLSWKADTLWISLVGSRALWLLVGLVNGRHWWEFWKLEESEVVVGRGGLCLPVKATAPASVASPCCSIWVPISPLPFHPSNLRVGDNGDNGSLPLLVQGQCKNTALCWFPWAPPTHLQRIPLLNSFQIRLFECAIGFLLRLGKIYVLNTWIFTK